MGYLLCLVVGTFVDVEVISYLTRSVHCRPPPLAGRCSGVSGSPLTENVAATPNQCERPNILPGERVLG